MAHMGQDLGFVLERRLGRIPGCQCSLESLTEVLLCTGSLLSKGLQFAPQCQVSFGQPDLAIGFSLWDRDASLPRK